MCVHRTLSVFERKTICLRMCFSEKRRESAEKEWKNEKRTRFFLTRGVKIHIISKSVSRKTGHLLFL